MIEPYVDGAEHDPTKWWTDPAVQKALREGATDVESGQHRGGHLIRAGRDLILIQSLNGEPLRRHVKRSVYPGAIVSNIGDALSVRREGASPSLEERLEQMLAQLNVLTAHVVEIRALNSQSSMIGMGHNNPPQDGELLAELLESIVEIKVELAKAAPLADSDLLVIERAEGRLARFRAWIDNRIDDAPIILAEAAIAGAGALVVNYVVKYQTEIIEVTTSLAQTINDWISYAYLLPG